MSSIKKFNPYQNIRIDKIKAHHTILKAKKEKPSFRDTTDWEGDYEGNNKAPWEHTHVKGLQAGKQKPKLVKDKIFDVKNDGKMFKKKKETKADKLSRAFVMFDDKKYHQIDGKFRVAGL